MYYEVFGECSRRKRYKSRLNWLLQFSPSRQTNPREPAKSWTTSLPLTFQIPALTQTLDELRIWASHKLTQAAIFRRNSIILVYTLWKHALYMFICFLDSVITFEFVNQIDPHVWCIARVWSHNFINSPIATRYYCVSVLSMRKTKLIRNTRGRHLRVFEKISRICSRTPCETRALADYTRHCMANVQRGWWKTNTNRGLQGPLLPTLRFIRTLGHSYVQTVCSAQHQPYVYYRWLHMYYVSALRVTGHVGNRKA